MGVEFTAPAGGAVAPAVYLDHNATTPLDPRVLEAMLPWLAGRCGNPSSVHAAGRAAHAAVETAREQVAALVGARPPEVVFTASGTEANNAVVFGVAELAGHRGRILLSPLEHPSVRRAAERAAARGMAIDSIDPSPDGVVPAEAVIAALRDDTRLVAMMLANNELGTVQPVAEVAAACRARGIPLLCDAVQAAGKIPVAVGELGADFVVLGAHKFHGPLGAAALRVRSGVELPPFLVGGGQERRRRASTPNVPAVAGFGRAAELAAAELPARTRHLAALRDRFEAGQGAIGGATVHGLGAPRLPNTSHVAFAGVEGEPLAIRLDLAGFAVSTGSACASGAVEPSAALLAMGVPRAEALASLRVSVGMTTTAGEIDRFLAALGREVAALRALLGSGRPSGVAAEVVRA
jgi:cysteine desulfurase